MRNILFVFFLLQHVLVFSQVHVKGYLRKDGTYVQPHQRSVPDGNPYNNYSYPGNVNPHTGKIATGDPDKYLEKYNNGRNIYNEFNEKIYRDITSNNLDNNLDGNKKNIDQELKLNQWLDSIDINIKNNYKPKSGKHYSEFDIMTLSKKYDKKISYYNRFSFNYLYNIENILFKLGILDKDEVDGEINFVTIESIIEFQDMFNVNPDGLVGKETFYYLYSFIRSGWFKWI
ncbi:peptidoglycan-binding protein [Siphonobacter sp. BAB-5385]|uniref:peptidoglycan-binding domain-containing protein n=1 Tax=Siphonobacter sp. BAB-5385 TaxID=1864822 RepID=UPI00159609CA|nr:peptidoglycan-binding protein [Siphonobacter sp. BAB-5385]